VNYSDTSLIWYPGARTKWTEYWSDCISRNIVLKFANMEVVWNCPRLRVWLCFEDVYKV